MQQSQYLQVSLPVNHNSVMEHHGSLVNYQLHGACDYCEGLQALRSGAAFQPGQIIAFAAL